MEVEYVTITKGRLDYLMSRHIRLNQLEAAGVDNWEGYPIMYDDGKEDDDE